MSAVVRRIRHELLGAAILGVPFLLAVEIASASSARLSLGHHWQTTVAELNSAYPVLHPLVAGISAAVSRPLFDDTQRALTEVLPRRGLRPVAVRAAVIAGWLVLTHLLVITAVLTWAWAIGVPGRPSLWGLLPGIGGIVAWVGVGLFAARLAPRWWTPPAVAGVGYLALFAGQDVVNPAFYETGGASTWMYGLVYRADVATLQLVLGCTVGAAAVVLAAGSRGGLAVPRTAAGTLVVALVLLTLALVDRGPDLYAESPVSWRCSKPAPRLCVVREDSALLVSSRARLVRALGSLRTLDPTIVFPGTFRQPVGQRPPAAHRDGVFGVVDGASDEQAILDVLQSVSRCSTEWTERQLGELDQVVAYSLPGSAPGQALGKPTRAVAAAALDDLVRC